MEKILLLDVSLEKEYQTRFMDFGLTVEWAEDLTQSIINWSGWSAFDPRQTVIVLPGNGASIVQSYLPKNWINQWQWQRVHAKRHWIPGQSPRVVANRIWSQQMRLGIKDIVIIDDVVSSGGTCKVLRMVNRPWIPRARWQAVTWLKQASASLRGIDSCFAVKSCGTADRKAPINSLSTLLEDKEIAVSYAQRNFPGQSEEFLTLLAEINNRSF